MISTDKLLERLFKAARRAPQPELGPAPLGLATRVVARWREAKADTEWLAVLRLLRRAALMAGLLSVVALLFGLREITRSPADELSVANSIVNTYWVP
jgi:hypothetical protein